MLPARGRQVKIRGFDIHLHTLYDLSKYSSSLAAIHTVLKRLRDADEVRFIQLDSGRFAYEWDRPPKTQVLNEAPLARLESRPTKTRKR